MIISNKHDIYELPHELPNDLSLSRILGNWEISGKSQNFKEFKPSLQSSPRNENFLNTRRTVLKNRNGTLSVERYFT